MWCVHVAFWAVVLLCCKDRLALKCEAPALPVGMRNSDGMWFRDLTLCHTVVYFPYALHPGMTAAAHLHSSFANASIAASGLAKGKASFMM